jgi:hypothetical protein
LPIAAGQTKNKAAYRKPSKHQAMSFYAHEGTVTKTQANGLVAGIDMIWEILHWAGETDQRHQPVSEKRSKIQGLEKFEPTKTVYRDLVCLTG